MADDDHIFRADLNRHGYGFQHAVVQALQSNRHRGWLPETTEFPVSYRGRTTHIDVLASAIEKRVLLVGECKRVNPAVGRWVFAKSPFTFERENNVTWLEKLVPSDHQNIVARSIPFPVQVDTFHLAVESNTPNAKGDRDGAAKGRALQDSLAGCRRCQWTAGHASPTENAAAHQRADHHASDRLHDRDVVRDGRRQLAFL
jgi:hypothetical protein